MKCIILTRPYNAHNLFRLKHLNKENNFVHLFILHRPSNLKIIDYNFLVAEAVRRKRMK